MVRRPGVPRLRNLAHQADEGRIVVDPSAPPSLLASLLGQLDIPPDSRSASPSGRKSPTRAPSPHLGAHQAWGADDAALRRRQPPDPAAIDRHKATSKKSTLPKAEQTGQRMKENEPQQPARPQLSSALGRTMLFSGEVCLNPNLKSGAAVIFRRPSSCNIKPHTRPVFVAGGNCEDPKNGVDCHDPRLFSSARRAIYNAAYNKALMRQTAGREAWTATPVPQSSTPRPASTAGSVKARTPDIACRPSSASERRAGSVRTSSAMSGRQGLLTPAPPAA
mmetsp:Transcript_17426/g.40701  ORF Transcript_17426/g.40701 Transcript_17426/m.40701 type:complete len:278 (-) Transcript_17426:84-917(-)